MFDVRPTPIGTHSGLPTPIADPAYARETAAAVRRVGSWDRVALAEHHGRRPSERDPTVGRVLQADQLHRHRLDRLARRAPSLMNLRIRALRSKSLAGLVLRAAGGRDSGRGWSRWSKVGPPGDASQALPAVAPTDLSRCVPGPPTKRKQTDGSSISCASATTVGQGGAGGTTQDQRGAASGG